MSKHDFRKTFPHIDVVTEWYLGEIVYCLEHYVGMDSENAYSAVTSSDYLSEMLADYPEYLGHETAFYWAMCIVGNSFWWHDKRLREQHNEYVKERHHPPRTE